MKYSDSVAKGGNSIFQYIITLFLIVLGYFIGQAPLTIAIFFKMNSHVDIGTEELKEFNSNPDFSLLHIDKNVGFLLLLCTFLGAMAALILSIKYIHKRNFLSLFSFEEKIDWKRMVWSTALWFGMLLIVELVLMVLNPDIYIYRKPDYTFLLLVVIVFLVLPFQTAFEELLVRGYLFQSVTYNSKSIILGLLVSILVFAALHGANPEMAKFGIAEMMSYYIFAALILGLIVIFDDRIELAIGVHTATNMFGALFVTYRGAAIQTDSLFLSTEISPIFQAFEILILGLIFIFIAKWKYGWDFTKIKFKWVNE